MHKNIYENLKREPLAAIAILLTLSLSIFQSEWLSKLLSEKIYLNAYYIPKSDGRCSLTAFSVDNKKQKNSILFKNKNIS